MKGKWVPNNGKTAPLSIRKIYLALPALCHLLGPKEVMRKGGGGGNPPPRTPSTMPTVYYKTLNPMSRANTLRRTPL